MWKLWLLLIIILSVIGTFSYIGHLHDVVEAQKIELQVGSLKLKEKQQEVNSLTDSIIEQNEAIMKLNEETVKLSGVISSVNKRNRQLTTQLQEKINSIITDNIPEDCAGAVINLKKFSKELAGEWNKK